jgi:hypothetical protein
MLGVMDIYAPGSNPICCTAAAALHTKLSAR